jgi:hypothetical protein
MCFYVTAYDQRTIFSISSEIGSTIGSETTDFPLTPSGVEGFAEGAHDLG